MTERPLICGFLKVRNELLRSGNVVRAVKHLQTFCDTIVACDDASYDGTRAYLQRVIPPDQLLLIEPGQQDFRKELAVKQEMLQIVHRLQPHWIWWHDADEELEAEGVAKIRAFCAAQREGSVQAYRSRYVQLWRNRTWYRLDDGFNDGWFLKLWRWSPALSFDVQPGTHLNQFPQQFLSLWNSDKIGNVPWKVIHWGNYGVNLRWKCIQYWGGLGGVERHLSFEDGEFAKIDPTLSPNLRQDEPKPVPFTPSEKARIRSFRNLKGLEGTFTVVIPTHNRAAYLPTTLQSLLDQTYDKWLALVLDDGSTDDTPALMAEWQERDPRIFYARYPKLGAVALNEIGMATACEWSSWWTRLGSDDYFEPHKLQLDAMALTHHEWVYGLYRVLRDGGLHEMCNHASDPESFRQQLLDGRFVVSWANCAARTSLLAKVRKVFGTFCDPRLQNMEDFLVNARLARFAAPVFRGTTGRTVVFDPDPATASAIQPHLIHDAIWRVNPVGATANTTLTASEDVLTRQLIADEGAVFDQLLAAVQVDVQVDEQS